MYARLTQITGSLVTLQLCVISVFAPSISDVHISSLVKMVMLVSPCQNISRFDNTTITVWDLRENIEWCVFFGPVYKLIAHLIKRAWGNLSYKKSHDFSVTLKQLCTQNYFIIYSLIFSLYFSWYRYDVETRNCRNWWGWWWCARYAWQA